MGKSAASKVPVTEQEIHDIPYWQVDGPTQDALLPMAKGQTNAANVLPYATQMFQNVSGSAGFDTAGVNNSGQNLMQAGNNLAGAAGGAWAAGQDPENALYLRNFTQQQDQTRAGLAARGIAMTPYGAGVENQANQNFNLDWADRQLGRQSTAANTASTLANTGAQVSGAGAQLLESVPAQWRSQIQQALSGLQTASNSADASQQSAIGELLQYIQEGLGAAQLHQQGHYQALNMQIQQGQARDQYNQSSAAGFGQLAGTALGFLGGL